MQFHRNNTYENVSCVINLSFVPQPWLRNKREVDPSFRTTKLIVYEALYQTRLHPTGTPKDIDAWWGVSTCSEIHPSGQAGEFNNPDRLFRDVHTAAADMASQLERFGWPVLNKLLESKNPINQLHHKDLGFATHGRATSTEIEALLLMDQGLSPQLDEILTRERKDASPQASDGAHRFLSWVRQQALHAQEDHPRP